MRDAITHRPPYVFYKYNSELELRWPMDRKYQAEVWKSRVGINMAFSGSKNRQTVKFSIEVMQDER